MKRRTTELSESLQRKLNAYALAASAAGVGMLALAQPTEARIVYTKTNKSIGVNTIFHLDLNHDGIADFALKNNGETYFGSYAGSLFAYPDRQKNAILGNTHTSGEGRHLFYAPALLANLQVGSKRNFMRRSLIMVAGNESGCSWPWCNVSNRYLGLEFAIKGRTHFGWARLNVSCSGYVSATLTGYAYETIPNKPIITGKTHGVDDLAVQPTSLGALAAGSSALSTWRHHNQGASK